MANLSLTNKIQNGTAVIVDDIHTVTIALTDFAQTDLDLMSTYGEALIDVGGEIYDSTTVYDSVGKTITKGALVATLPNNIRKIRSQLPFTQQFPSTAYTTVADVTAGYRATIKARIEKAIADLRDTTDEDLTAVDTTTPI